MRAIVVPIIALVILAGPLPRHAEGTAGSLLSNGNFRVDADGNGWPDGWPRAEGASWQQDEDGGRFVRMTGLGIDKMPTLYRSIRLPSGTRALQLTYRARAANVVVGKEKWHDARIITHFKNADGRELYPEPQLRTYSGSTDGWVKSDVMFRVPDGAKTFELIPAMFYCKSGEFDLADIDLVPIDPRAIEARRIGTPISEPVAAVTDLRAGSLPSSLKVIGNQLQDETGKAVRLQGVNVVGLESSPSGHGVLPSIRIAVEQWKANVIRLPVNDVFWFGKGPEQTDGGAGYRALVDAAVQRAANLGAYAVIVLHRDGVPDPACADFWTDAAGRYKDHPAVLFGLFNEPGATTWAIWQTGMQGLVDTVRQTGAANVLIAGGLNRASDLSGIGDGFALADRSGAAGIVYDVHLYPWTKDWQSSFLHLADRYPLFIGQCGADTREFGISREHPAGESVYTWAPDVLAMIQQYRLHWAATSFSPETSPRLIDTWKYEPTPFWGAFVRVALSGGRYKLNRLR